MRVSSLIPGACVWLVASAGYTAQISLAPQRFQQELATRFTQAHGLPPGSIQLVDLAANHALRVFAGGRWWELREGRWQPVPALTPPSDQQFVFADLEGAPVIVSIPWREVRQLLRQNNATWIATAEDPFAVVNGAVPGMAQ